MQQGFPVVLAILLFIPSFLAIWASVCYLISLAGGWSALARVYRHEGSFSGQWLSWQTGYMRGGARYNGALKVGVDHNGLYLSVFPFFKVAHPTLFMPWGDVMLETGRFPGTLRLTFRQVPDIPLRLSPSLVEELWAKAGRRLPPIKP